MRKNTKISGSNNKNSVKTRAFCFLLYGSWEPLDSLRILPQGVLTFSTPGRAIPRIFQKSTFYMFSENRRRPIFVVAQSRHIAEFEGTSHISKRRERPTYWKGLPRFVQRIRESRVMPRTVEKHVQKPKTWGGSKSEFEGTTFLLLL